MADNQRQGREEAKFKAHLRLERSYEKKMSDIDWMYDKFYPLIDDYKAGRLVLTGEKPFDLDMKEGEVVVEGAV